MISLHDYRTEDALPAEMKTPERLASCRVFDIQKKKFMERLRRVYIWADLDKVEDDKLDFLAVESRVLFYNTSLSPEIKRSLKFDLLVHEARNQPGHDRNDRHRVWRQ